MKTLLILVGMGACLVALALVEQKPCKVPATETLGGVNMWDYCGSERERQAINDE